MKAFLTYAYREGFDPAEVVRRVAERAIRRIGDAETEVELLAARSLPAVRGDEARLESVLMRIVQGRLEQVKIAMAKFRQATAWYQPELLRIPDVRAAPSPHYS